MGPPKATIVLDTSALIHDLPLIIKVYEQAEQFDTELLLPQYTLKELDTIKDKNAISSELGKCSRAAINWLNRTMMYQESTILRGQQINEVSEDDLRCDDSILDCALYNKKSKYRQTLLMTNDNNLCLRAKVENLEAIVTSQVESENQIYEYLSELTADVMDLDEERPVTKAVNPFKQSDKEQESNDSEKSNAPNKKKVVEKRSSEVKYSQDAIMETEQSEEVVPTMQADDRHDSERTKNRSTPLDSIHSSKSGMHRQIKDKLSAMSKNTDKRNSSYSAQLSGKIESSKSTNNIERVHEPSESSSMQIDNSTCSYEKIDEEFDLREDEKNTNKKANETVSNNPTMLESIHNRPTSAESNRRVTRKHCTPDYTAENKNSNLTKLNTEIPPPVQRFGDRSSDIVSINILNLMDYYIHVEFTGDELRFLNYQKPDSLKEAVKMLPVFGYCLPVESPLLKSFIEAVKNSQRNGSDLEAKQFLIALSKNDHRYKNVCKNC